MENDFETIKLGSLFDGSGGFPLAGIMCGITPTWASEIEPYPIAVTRSRFPHMLHLGDVSKVNGADIEPVDVITFGSPCQDLSVAGKRAGLRHEDNGDEETTRSGLLMDAVRIIKEMRRATHGKYPTFAIWENVPGAFSSNKGEDFRIVLEELIKIVEPTATVPPTGKNGWPYEDVYMGDEWSVAYRVLDAQYWGVPQRRRRIYLVADFRGQRAGKILFERGGLRGYFETGRTPWQGIAADAERGANTADRENRLTPCTLKIRSGCEGGGKGALVQENMSAPLSTNNDQYLIETLPVYCLQGNGIDRADTAGCNGKGVKEDICYTLNTIDRPAVVYGVDCRNMTEYAELYPTLQAKSNGGQSLNFSGAVRVRYVVRRLTPTECARLQGFPDWWGEIEHKDAFTDEEFAFWQEVRQVYAQINGRCYTPVKLKTLLTWYNKLPTDSAKYKMWGNGLALPTALYVMQGIAAELTKN